MTPTREELERFAEAAAPLAGLVIEPERRAAVVASLQMAANMAELVLSFPLDESRDEPASVFSSGRTP